jgi:hypothetical protein
MTHGEKYGRLDEIYKILLVALKTLDYDEYKKLEKLCDPRVAELKKTKVTELVF